MLYGLEVLIQTLICYRSSLVRINEITYKSGDQSYALVSSKKKKICH